MASIQIDAVKPTDCGTCYELTSGRYTMSVFVAKGYVTTLVKNAANRAWRGLGKTYHGATRFEDARAAYKSPECQAMIDYVRAETAW